MRQVSAQRDPSNAIPCQKSHIKKTSRSGPTAPRDRADANVPNIFLSASAYTVVQVKLSLVDMDRETTAPLMLHQHDADNSLTPSTRWSSEVLPSKVSGEQAAEALASAILCASVARKGCEDLAEYLEERRAEAETMRLASMHAREEVQRAQMAQLARRDVGRSLVLVKQVHWDANVPESRDVLSPSGQSLAELELSRDFDLRKPDLGEAFLCTTPGCSLPTGTGETGDLCLQNCGANAAKCQGEACVQDVHEVESNGSTTDRENSLELGVCMDKFSAASSSGSSPGCPITLDMDLSFGALLVELDVPTLEVERSSLKFPKVIVNI